MKHQTAGLFDAIAPSYDKLNSILSLGFHRRWKRSIRKFLPEQSHLNILDLATGTADTAIELARHHPNIAMITGLDPSVEMLRRARQKINNVYLSPRINLKQGRAEDIPYDSSSFDVISMSFGIRNIQDRVKALNEMHRVLKPRGRLLILEFSRPDNPFLKFFYQWYMFLIVRCLGGVLSGDRQAYEYLFQSIKEFPPKHTFCHMLDHAGFDKINTNVFFAGVVTIYVADKKRRRSIW